MSSGSSKGVIVQLSVSSGGVPKLSVAEARITRLGLEGDTHRDLKHHGGPERAVCLFPVEAIDDLATEGHRVVPGALGENVTTKGLDWAAVVPGVQLLLGERAVLEVTKYTTPCFNLAPLFLDRDVSRVSQKRHPGWSRVCARVLREGPVRAGDQIRIVDVREVSELTAAASP